MSVKTLVIVESPAKCKKIESYLGSGYKVVASFGHLRTIENLKSIDIHNNFLAKYTIIKEDKKLKQIEKIRSEIGVSDEIILATDDDREGEAIAWHICELFGLSVTNTKRIIFHEITENAIKNAIKNPQRINMDLVHSQQSRQILDLLVGFTISPILWNCISKTHDSSLSAGRCQTPALRLVYENYLDIKQSAGKLVYNTIGYFTNLNLVFDLNKQFAEQNEVKNFLYECKKWQFNLTITSPKKTIRKAPEPLTTSSLQQLSSNELHMSPKETMKYAQQLYEEGYITYMRTDSKKYSQNFIEQVKHYIINSYGEQYVSQAIDNVLQTETHTVIPKQEEVKPQEAHEAIRPVNINIKCDTLNNELHNKAIKLYELIWKRAISSCMPSAQYNTISAKISAPADSEFIYKTDQPIFLGWQVIDKLTETNNYQYISSLKQNVLMNPKKLESKFNLIELKSHYSEARLVQLLEERGIGRPSTFASLIDKIQERKYVEKQNITGTTIECVDFFVDDLKNDIIEVVSKREFGNEKNKLVIQPLGIIVIEFLTNKFNNFFNYDYTKEMEDSLDKIAKGELEWFKLCELCFKELTNLTSNLKDHKKFSLEIDEKHTLIIGKHGPVIKCVDNNNNKNDKNISFLPVKKDIDINNLGDNKLLEDIIDNDIINKNSSGKIIGKYKGKDLFIKNGKYGIYAQWGNETRALKGDYSFDNIECEYINILKFLDKDLLDPSKPIGLVRELNSNLSIRSGKYGDYIFYKKLRMKTPKFFKLNGFKEDYKKCDKSVLLSWIKETHKVE